MSLRLNGTYEKNSDRSLWTLVRIEMYGKCTLQSGKGTAHVTDDELAKNYTLLNTSRF